MEEEEDSLDWDPMEPQTLLRSLKCPVCWEYFSRPHTIPCGHTFCTRCLQTLARISRTSKMRTPLDRLRIHCPSCRRRTLARPILRRRAAVNYAIKELVDEWFNSPYSSGSVDYITLRSVSAQTEQQETVEQPAADDQSATDVYTDAITTTTDDTQTCLSSTSSTSDNDAKHYSTSEHDADDISGIEFRTMLFHRINGKGKTLKSKVQKEPLDLRLPETASEDGETAVTEENAVTSSSEESESEPEIGVIFGNIQVVNDNDEVRPVFRRFERLSITTVIRLFFMNCMRVLRGIRSSRSRLFLTVFWFLYGAMIVAISRSFLPWMSFYTIIYFVIMYAEISSQNAVE